MYGDHVEGQYTELDQVIWCGINKLFTSHINKVFSAYSSDTQNHYKRDPAFTQLMFGFSHKHGGHIISSFWITGFQATWLGT